MQKDSNGARNEESWTPFHTNLFGSPASPTGSCFISTSLPAPASLLHHVEQAQAGRPAGGCARRDLAGRGGGTAAGCGGSGRAEQVRIDGWIAAPLLACPTRRWSTPPPQPLPPLLPATPTRRARETQAQLEASQAAYEELCTEHRRLQEQQQHEEREGYEVAALFRREMLAKSGDLVALQAEVALGAAALQAAAAAAAQREAQLQAGFAAERQQLAGTAAALQEQLDGLAEFRQHKEGLEAELQRLREEGARAAEESADKVRTFHSKRIVLGPGGDTRAGGQVARQARPAPTCIALHPWAHLQVRALQRRLYQLEGDAEAEAAAGEEGSSGADGDLCLEADLHRLLAHNRKAADEMQQYSQVEKW